MSQHKLRSARRQLISEAKQYLLAGDDEYALSLLRSALRLVKIAEALSNIDIAECLALMGAVHLRGDRPKEAEAHLRLALFTYDHSALSSEGVRRLIPLLMAACRNQGHFAETRELAQRYLGHSNPTLPRLTDSKFLPVIYQPHLPTQMLVNPPAA